MQKIKDAQSISKNSGAQKQDNKVPKQADLERNKEKGTQNKQWMISMLRVR